MKEIYNNLKDSKKELRLVKQHTSKLKTNNLLLPASTFDVQNKSSSKKILDKITIKNIITIWKYINFLTGIGYNQTIHTIDIHKNSSIR